MDLCAHTHDHLRQEVPPASTRKWLFSSSRFMEAHLIQTGSGTFQMIAVGLPIPSEIQPEIMWTCPSGECQRSFPENNQWNQRRKEWRIKTSSEALLSEEFSPWSCHGDGQLEEGLRFVSQKQEVSLMFLQLQSQPNAISHLHGVNMKSVLVRLQERCVCEAVFVPGTERKRVFLFALTSCWTSTVPLCVIGELFRKWKSDAGISLVGACEPDCQLPNCSHSSQETGNQGQAADVTDSEGPQRHPAGTHRFLHYSSSTPEPHRHGDGKLMLLLQVETSH